LFALPVAIFHDQGLVAPAAALNVRNAKVSLRRKRQALGVLFQDALLFSLPFFQEGFVASAAALDFRIAKVSLRRKRATLRPSDAAAAVARAANHDLSP